MFEIGIGVILLFVVVVCLLFIIYMLSQINNKLSMLNEVNYWLARLDDTLRRISEQLYGNQPSPLNPANFEKYTNLHDLVRSIKSILENRNIR